LIRILNNRKGDAKMQELRLDYQPPKMEVALFEGFDVTTSDGIDMDNLLDPGNNNEYPLT
jgi:hypothetical protein